jgi:hypothetical protein
LDPAPVALGLPFVFSLPLALAFRAGRALTEPPVGLAAVPGLAAAVFGRGAAVGFAARVDLAFGADAPVVAGLAAAVDRAAVPGLAPPDLAVPGLALADLADALFGLATVAVRAGVFGAVADTAWTAAVSDLVAEVIALLALFIACMAVDIALAEDVAFVAAAVILVAADVTLVAAVDTVRTADAPGAFAEALRVVASVARAPAVVCGLRTARLAVLPLVDPVRAALAGLRRGAVWAVVRAGTDLPPARSITEVLFHAQRRFTHTVMPIVHTMTTARGEQWPQAPRKQPLIRQDRLGVAAMQVGHPSRRAATPGSRVGRCDGHDWAGGRRAAGGRRSRPVTGVVPGRALRRHLGTAGAGGQRAGDQARGLSL